MNRNGSVNPAEDFELIPASASRDSFRRPLEQPSAPSGSGQTALRPPVSFKEKHRLLGGGGGGPRSWFCALVNS